jgi:hypothetical protein
MEVVQVVKTGNVVTYQRSMPRRRTLTTMAEIDPGRSVSAAPVEQICGLKTHGP